MAYIGINVNEVAERSPVISGSTVLPNGMYDAVVVKTSLKDTKYGGKYFEVEFNIVAPEQYSKRKYWERFNVKNSKPETMRMAKEQLADLVKAVGLNSLGDEEELHHRQCALNLYVKKSTNPEYPDPTNACGKFWPVGTTLEQHLEWAGKGKQSTNTSTQSTAKPAWGAATAPAPQVAPLATTAPWKK